MELKKVIIRNFKSIESCDLEINKGCRVFVGVSESGKSNLLQALSILDENVPLSKELIKEGTRTTEDAYIKYVLKSEENDISNICEIFEEKIYTSNVNKIVKRNGSFIKLINFINKEFVYYVDIRKNLRKVKYYSLDEKDIYEISPNYVFISGTAEAPIKITNIKTNEENQITTKIIINKDEYAFDEAQAKNITVDSLYEYVSIISVEYVRENMPNVLFWEYKDEFLLPSSIITTDFINNPEINVPLKYIFNLDGIDDIKAEYNERKEMGEASFQNLLDQVSNTVNDYLKKVWKSMPKTCRLELHENGDKINIRIKDSNNSYLLDKRSDGFKRLITYMIMLSVKNTNDLLNNTLILIDEPETKIDIPGQEYLKMEMINNIGKNNYIFYSTHSTSMIDNSNIGRHYIVSKSEECTNIEDANEDNYDSALTLYKALGMQIYAIINEKNLVFEGWTDTQIFKVGLNKLSKTKKDKFKNVGITHVPGATKFKDFASFWGLLSRKYYIISDADDTSSGLKESFEKEHYNADWYKYNELGDLNNIQTCEDFIEPDYIIKKSEKFGSKYGFTGKINSNKLEDSSIPNIKTIEEWIHYNESDSKRAKKLLTEFKSLLAEDIKKENITSDYLILLDKLIEILFK